jgi:class 3 adenylate cyclase
MTAGVACARCGTAQRDNAKFCDACGSALAARAHTPEYKQVTVLFADVVGSMEIAAAVDPERWREIMTALVERLAAVVRRYGGTVEYTGDGVMALFGAPMALEDHAFRACLAALAIQRQTNGLAGEVRHRDGVELRLRVGLNSGRVIAGEVGSGSKRYAATGTSVGMAQRMESVAPPGGVMLSESTARLVEHAATLAVPEWVRIKGADEPVPARQLIAIEPRHGLLGRAESSLVGRGSEMAALDAVVDRTIDGRGAVVNVVGPPGIGKTRVAREAAAWRPVTGSKWCGPFASRTTVTSPSPWSRDCCGQRPASPNSMDRPPARRSRSRLPTPTPRIWFCSRICSPWPTPTSRCLRSTRMRGGGG